MDSSFSFFLSLSLLFFINFIIFYIHIWLVSMYLYDGFRFSCIFGNCMSSLQYFYWKKMNEKYNRQNVIQRTSILFIYFIQIHTFLSLFHRWTTTSTTTTSYISHRSDWMNNFCAKISIAIYQMSIHINTHIHIS